jgi:hypothetical protein
LRFKIDEFHTRVRLGMLSQDQVRQISHLKITRAGLPCGRTAG